MKAIMPGLGILLLAVGAIWTLQGLNVIKGSFMTGQALWGWIGLACLVAGIALLYTSFRGRVRS
jgi:hypothetical protein